MSAVSRIAAVLVAGTATLAALAGCGTDDTPPPAPPAAPDVTTAMPPRPVELRLDGIKPCELLTASQLSALGIPDKGQNAPNSDLLGSNSCLWAGSSIPPHGSPQVTAVTKQGVDYFRNPEDKVIDIAGMPALEATSADLDPASHCLVLVDVAAGQTLWVQYSPEGPAPNASTHDIACDRTREVAQAMVSTLRGLLHR
jgi:hypothetical protein